MLTNFVGAEVTIEVKIGDKTILAQGICSEVQVHHDGFDYFRPSETVMTFRLMKPMEQIAEWKNS